MADVFFPIVTEFQHDLFLVQPFPRKGKPGKTLHRTRPWNRVKQIKPPGHVKAGIQSNPQQTRLSSIAPVMSNDHRQTGDLSSPSPRFIQMNPAGSFHDKHPTIAGNGDFHGINKALSQRLDPEMLIPRKPRGGCQTAESHHESQPTQ